MIFFKKPTPNETIFGFLYFILQLIIIPGIVMAVIMMLPEGLSITIVNFVYFSVNFVAVLIIFRKFLAANFKSLLAYPWHTLRCAAIGLLIYIAGINLSDLVVITLVPDFTNVNDAAILEMVKKHYTLMSIGTVFLAPLAEECFYRGLFFRNLYDRHPILAYLVSMVVFSLVHVLNYVGMESFGTLALCFVQYLPAGFALAWCYRRSGSIFAPVLIHMVVNQTGMLLMR
jgi:membrane protease YdiL (CAAX protease family)